MFDDHAFEVLRRHFDREQLDRVYLDGQRPFLPLDQLLAIFTAAVQHNARAACAPAPEMPYVSVEEGMAAGRVLAGHLNDTVSGWMTGHLREQGTTWPDIGRLLGVSKQAAWQRFRKYEDSMRAYPSLYPNFSTLIPEVEK